MQDPVPVVDEPRGRTSVSMYDVKFSVFKVQAFGCMDDRQSDRIESSSASHVYVYVGSRAGGLEGPAPATALRVFNHQCALSPPLSSRTARCSLPAGHWVSLRAGAQGAGGCGGGGGARCQPGRPLCTVDVPHRGGPRHPRALRRVGRVQQSDGLKSTKHGTRNSQP
jgi:hypothetical protein